MAIYIALINYTDQGTKNMKEAQERVLAARQLLESKSYARWWGVTIAKSASKPPS